MTVAEAEELIKKGKIFLQFVLYRLEIARLNLVDSSGDAAAAPLRGEIRALVGIVERARQLYGQDYVNVCAPDGPIA